MGSDMYMNPPRPVWTSVIQAASQETALSYVIGAMANGWKVELSPTHLDREDGDESWSVRVFKGEYI